MRRGRVELDQALADRGVDGQKFQQAVVEGTSREHERMFAHDLADRLAHIAPSPAGSEYGRMRRWEAPGQEALMSSSVFVRRALRALVVGCALLASVGARAAYAGIV